MNIFKAIKRLPAIFNEARWESFTLDDHNAWLKLGFAGSDSISPEAARRCTTVFSCVRLLSDTIAQLPLNLMQIESNGNKLHDSSNPLYSILKYSPNAWQTAFDYWKWNMECLCYRGWFISLKTYDAKGKINGLIPLHPDTVKIKQQQDSSLMFEGRAMVTAQKTVELKSVAQKDVFFCMYATSDGIHPVSPISYNAESIELSLQAMKHGNSFLKNDATPPLVIEYPNRVDERGLKLLAQQWKKKGSGDNYGSPKVIESGAKVNKLSISNQDAQYLELRQFQKEDICGIFGVPVHMVSDTKQAKGWSTAEMQGIDFVTYTVNPWTVRIEQSARKSLIPRYQWPSYEIKHNTNALMRGDLRARVEYYNKMRLMGTMSANEIRQKEDMNLREDESGDEYWIPANIIIDDGRNNGEIENEEV